ncbi:hypothetical protein [Streptomyces naganishii]|uniref:Uncharacterized protein n=1 Tax=Streptomyces naganishii JCM 4654 TaxID=1306179 RepID=A0A918XZR5_9ACTN|nr:hypothetical protein [Streptomyces naganishii]GHD84624.1 hypothetical protein GCM10010508_05450 [Streptomyces naganishii JCM 4654]
MRLSRSVASVTVAVALVLSLPYEAMPHARVRTGPPTAAEPFGATCRTSVSGSRVTAYCHNPYPGTDRVGLHIECARWWDLDSDGSPVDVGPAQTVRLTGRCWMEVRSAWVSHERA